MYLIKLIFFSRGNVETISSEITYNYIKFSKLGTTEISETPKLTLEEFIVEHGGIREMNGSLAAVHIEKDKLK